LRGLKPTEEVFHRLIGIDFKFITTFTTEGLLLDLKDGKVFLMDSFGRLIPLFIPIFLRQMLVFS